MTRVHVTPKRDLGQHFLVDDNLLGVIARLAELEAGDIVLEIGPGLGALTVHLASRVARVIAVEIDPTLEPELTRRLAASSNVELVFADALAIDPGSFAYPPSKLVANLPYNVATPIVVESLDRLPSVQLWCVMVQREIADRFFAVPGTKVYGAVSVLLQLATERTGFHPVSRSVFRPRPNVESALVAFRRRQLPPSYSEIKRVVQAAFAHRRKTLPNSLELAGVAARARSVEALAALGHVPAIRAEALRPEEFAALTELLA